MQNSVLKYLSDTAKNYPQNVALVDSNGKIMFSELNSKAKKVATLIREKNTNHNIPVFVYLPKSNASIISFMGILYSGNFYTPTDVRFPVEKPKSIIACLEPEVYISDEENSKKLLEIGVPLENIIFFDKIDFENVAETDLSDKIIDTDIAYTLFTSGSTGVPKGVAITHRSIIDYIDWAKDEYKITENDSLLNQAPFYFDNSTLDVYLMLSTGATLHIVPEMFYTFPAKLLQYLQTNAITTIFWVPSVLINVANSDLLSKVDCSCLKNVLFAGEVMPNKQLNYWRKKLPDSVYSNLYGPTEITVDCTYYTVNRDFSDDEPLPIGVPCRNSDVMILSDKDELITEKDKTGELCVRGTSLAAGYWNNPEKTAQAFVQNPFNKHYPERIYRTGDLVHYNEFGEIMYDGRKDFQIKHMGYRIELGEIETAAGSISGVQNACCVYDMQNKEIHLFYEAASDIDDNHMRKQLVTLIPKYMVPTKYKKLEKFPYNGNGKIDRLVLKQMITQE